MCALYWNTTHIFGPLLTLVVSINLKIFNVVLLNALIVYLIFLNERLNILGLQTLEYRRLFCDLVTMYKIVHNLFDIDRDSFIILAESNSTRNSTLKIFKPRVTASLRAKFICVRCINAWNYLPCSVRTASSVFNFKKKLKLCDLSTFLTVFIFQLQF